MHRVRFCFVDMDGVLADFVTGACQAHNRPNPYLTRNFDAIFNMEKVWNISMEEFWSPLNFDGFWLNLQKLPDADRIINLACALFGTKNVCLLTAPSQDHHCIPEKQAWVQKYYPELKNNMLFGSAKRFLAGEDRVLVDDRDENICNFINHGGNGVLVPQLWNRGFLDYNRSFIAVRENLYRVIYPFLT
jgi:5'(3')-deoxyribonucleotidase